MSDFTQRHGSQESPELEKAKGEEEMERDQGPEAEEPQLKHELAQVRWGRLVGQKSWLPAVSREPEFCFFFH